MLSLKSKVEALSNLLSGKLRSNPLVRIISEDKIVESKLLNLCGVQVVRTMAARAIYNLRPVEVPHAVVEKIDELNREGVVVLPEFLPRDRFELIQQEGLALMEENREKATFYKHGPNTVHYLSVLPHFGKNKAPAIYQFLDDARIRTILQLAEKRSLGPFDGRIEHLHQGIGSDQDGETELHSDIFFHTHKAWLYLNDVENENAPLVYVKRSHQLRPARLYYAYKESCTRNGGSRRISREEFERLGLEETIMTCPKNTLVIANTCGYHRRLRGKPGRDRYAVHVSLRYNPFPLWLYPRPNAGPADRALN